ncbi:Uncharacterized protein OnM2_091020 [Erysiphe neolycopersici]|uniref:Zinc metalloprotease n=1 Tax=Erysiphe neolycopersici TaxID=212602 RepID=A0A420HCU8_9PEZI|nr:Uncharacterized protein OnM2_091020 [Erysiphe neolycopersici]
MPSKASGDKSFFRKTQHFSTDYSPVALSHYVSERTGMQVIIVDKKGPKINGYFTLATEIFDDSGSPHTLEHLVFMGSKNYKYKGLLDKLASRAYSNTNAWTATDHTTYTLDTAGWDGFAQILPVYLEHVILPTLTDEACYTEVHHVDGEGNDAGVVYSEMQAIQNTSNEIMDLAARRLLYPKNVGFRYETGGLMENLRILTPERIRSFHKEMYQPKNLCLVLDGEVNQAHLFEILDKFEEGILNDIPPPEKPFRRPWIDSPQPPPIKETIIETVSFPEEDESSGEVMVALFGPEYNDELSYTAIDLILTYLAGSPATIIENVIVEQERLASSVSYMIDARPNTVIWFQASGVVTEKLAFVEKRIFELINEVCSNSFNIKYMLECVRREKRQVKFQAENLSSYFALTAIDDFLFGKRDGSTFKRMRSIDNYDKLEKWGEDDWCVLIKKWLLDAPHISILGTPSKKMVDEIKSSEEARIEARRKELGPEGLKKLDEKLKAAISKNDTEIPTVLLEQFPVPDTESIHFIESLTARSGLAKSLGTPNNYIQRIIDSNCNLPLFIQFEHVPSNFVNITLLLGTSGVEAKHLPLLPLFFENFFKTPIMNNGKEIKFEEVVQRLEKDTVSFVIKGGGNIGYDEGITITFQVEPEKYSAAIKWIHTMIFDSIFDETRISAAIARILAEIPELKRDGYRMAGSVDSMIHLDNNSSVKARNTLVKAFYMKRLKKIFNKDPKSVISSLEDLKKSIFRFNNMRVLIITDVNKLQSPIEPWKPIVDNLKDADKPLLPIIKTSHYFNADGMNPGNYGVVIVPMSNIDSSYCLASTKGPVSFTDPILPALNVAISFLETVEGPLWTAIRGKGLAYGSQFRCDVDGHIQFSIYRSPDSYRAFQAGKAIIESYINGSTMIEKYALEGAISSLIAGLSDKQATMAMAGKSHFINSVIKGVDDDYDTAMLKAVRNISISQIKNVMRDFLIPVFTPGQANIVLTCAVIMRDANFKSFEESGFKVRVQDLNDFKGSYGLETTKDNDEDDEESEEEDDSSSEISGTEISASDSEA